MRKLIIILFSIMLLSITMFGCANSDLKISNTLELKDEYKNSVSTVYADNFIECTERAIYEYENIEELNIGVNDKAHVLMQKLINSKEGSKLSESEMFLGTKVANLNANIYFYTIGTNFKEDKTKIDEEMQTVLDLYK